MKIDLSNNKITIPRYLFRYLRDDSNLNATLSEPYLWFSDTENFNDPFDLTNVLTAESSADDLIWYLKKYLPPGMKDIFEYKEILLDKDKRNEIFKSMYVIQEMIHKIYISDIGVCCFSYKHDSTLMWSHYTGGHSGVCVVMDTKRFISEFALIKVNYVDKLPKWNMIKSRKKWGNTPAYNLNFDQIVLGTKYKHWKYEKEYRLISRNKGKHLLSPEAIMGIITGAKMNNKKKNEIKDIANQVNKNMEIIESELNHSSGKVEVKGFPNEMITLPISGVRSIHEPNANKGF